MTLPLLSKRLTADFGKGFSVENLDRMLFFYHVYSKAIRELERQFDSALYQRLALSRVKEEIRHLAEKGHLIVKPADLLKDPYILEFLDLPEHPHYSESDFEQALIDKLEHFLLELGKGFTFVGRQVRISFDETF